MGQNVLNKKNYIFQPFTLILHYISGLFYYTEIYAKFEKLSISYVLIQFTFTYLNVNV